MESRTNKGWLRYKVSQLFWLSVFAVICLFGATKAVSASPVSVPNAIQFTDTDHNIVQAHAGSVMKEGGYYYWFGESRINNGGLFYAVAVYRSTDLKNWEFRNNVLTQNSDPELAQAYIERPKVIYNSTTDKYVMWMHKENGINYSEGRVAVAYSDTIDGNYTYTGSFQPTVGGISYDSRDMTVFQDDNGDAYLFSSASNPDRVNSWNSTMNIFKLTADYMNVASKVSTIFKEQYREAPAVFKRNGVYFLLTSTTDGWNPTQQKYATTTNIAGTWSSLKNVGDATCFDSQTGFVMPIQDSSNNVVSYMYMGDRWGASWGGKTYQSQYVWAPIVFTSNTDFTFQYYDNLVIDTEAGTITGNNNVFDANAVYTFTNNNSGLAMSVQGTSNNVKQDALGTGSQLWKIVPLTDKGITYHYIVNQANGKYLTMSLMLKPDGSYDAAATLANDRPYTMAAKGTDSTSQQWQINKHGNGTYTLINRKTKSYLDVQGQSLTAGAQLVQNVQTASVSQKWTIQLSILPPAAVDTTKTYALTNRNSGKSLGTVGNSTASGINIEQQSYTGAVSQSWKFVRDLSTGYYKIKNVNSGLFMEVKNASAADGAQIIQAAESTSTSQQWELSDAGGGYFVVKNRNSGKVLCMNNGTTADGGYSIQWSVTGSVNQNWSFAEITS
ncbi:RICIN domain-containing protein [Paenibacillus pasadenensis]|uniref:RICIN domain-containing protein n=1 Tax=Paenibacillus pasadenensis TaxID=217090 RepID=UPI00203D09D3|nr:RICIN domain-containing protein [Paenibacillus pasadenensis]MCM3748704.1 RICIN domain-containing protein [Paenibacillus pasadenensis]